MAIVPIPVADIEVPQELDRLRDLSYNMWWSWTPRARRLFASINPQLWARYRNPVQLLINIEPHYWKDLLGNEAFMSDYRRMIREFDRYMEGETPFQQKHGDYDRGPIAYFSTEFGIHESLGIYCGGLGVLSGDHAKAASDMGLPFIGVGILYRSGYFRQAIDPDGRQHHIFKNFDFYRLPLRPLHDTTGRDLIVTLDFPGREIQVKVWQLTVGRIKLYLMDTDIQENDPADRPITSQLYVRGREMRLSQELVLGMAGYRALKALGVEPAAWHMNEGHSVFLVMERMRDLMKQGRSWEEAKREITEKTAFTTHTPVPAGNETFDVSLVKKYMQHVARDMGVDVERILELGYSYPEGSGQPFNLTALAFRFSSYHNGVSKLHGEVSCQMWKHLFPEGDPEPVKGITNGVHVATWLGYEVRELIHDKLGSDWKEHVSDHEYFARFRDLADEDVWEAHSHQKDRMVRLVRNRLVQQFARHGKSPDEMREVSHMLDPKALTLGFARRFATYKRAGLIFQDYNRLKAILTNPERPVQLVFSGKAHPADLPGQELVKQIVNMAFYSDLRGHVFFVEDYEMRIARHLVQGVDVWLNTPRRPREASGTSGMKAAMNGAPNFSISDGWWPEAHNGKNGWIIGEGREFDNEERQDYEDVTSFYEILENQIVPAYYDNRKNGVPETWSGIMKESIATIVPQFSACRMLEDYVEQAYLPLAAKDL